MSDTNAWQEARIAELKKALKPFAAIEPSSLHPADGSENEPYIVVLKDCNVHPVAFTGGDLANARAVLSQGDRTASVSDQRELETK